jgi:hypothetical protein
MDQMRQAELELRLSHRHHDGAWSEMRRVHHDPAEHDPERAWERGQVFQCTSCDERVVVADPVTDAPLD